MKRVDPLRIKYEDGTEYILEFNRESVSYAEVHGFSREDAANRLMTMLPELFYYSFRMHHPNIDRDETDRILFKDLEGLTPNQIERLVTLYNAPYETLVKEEGEKPKNSKMTVVM